MLQYANEGQRKANDRRGYKISQADQGKGVGYVVLTYHLS